MTKTVQPPTTDLWEITLVIGVSAVGTGVVLLAVVTATVVLIVWLVKKKKKNRSKFSSLANLFNKYM